MNRTRDLLITNQLLYQLSYTGYSSGWHSAYRKYELYRHFFDFVAVANYSPIRVI